MKTGLGRKGGGRCVEASIGPEPSGSVVHGLTDIRGGGDPRTTNWEKGGGYQSNAVCRDLFEAGGREN